MKIIVKKGATSVLVRVFFQDTTSTTGAGLTGLTASSAGLVCYRARDDDGNAGGTQVVLSAGTRGTWSSGGFVEKDATNMPGLYEFGVDNAGLAAGTLTVDYSFKGATNLAQNLMEVQLVAYDPQDAVHLGLSALPNTAVTTNGSLLTSGTGTDQLSVASGRIDVGKILGTASTGTAGYVGLDWSHINAPTTTVDLSGTTIKNLDNNPPGYPANFSALVITAGGYVHTVSNAQKNTALAGYEFQMVDSTTFLPRTGLTVTGQVSQDGGAYGALTNAVSEIGNGTYTVNLAAADLNANVVNLKFTAAGAAQANNVILTVP